MDLLQGLKEGLEWGAAEVGDGAQAREQTPVQHLLEVSLTDVLREGVEEEGRRQTEPELTLGLDGGPPSCPDCRPCPTSMVVLRSNFSASWVM